MIFFKSKKDQRRKKNLKRKMSYPKKNALLLCLVELSFRTTCKNCSFRDIFLCHSFILFPRIATCYVILVLALLILFCLIKHRNEKRCVNNYQIGRKQDLTGGALGGQAPQVFLYLLYKY